MRAKVFGSLALLGALAFTGLVHARIDPVTRADYGGAYVPTPQTARMAAIGFDAVMADYYWLQAVQAVGGEHIVDEDLGRTIGKLIDVVTTLDPWVDHPYRFAAIWMTEGEENVRTAIALLRRGVEYHPDDWRNWFYIGFDHFYFLGENDEAAEALQRAAALPDSPAYLPRLVARLRSSTADIDVSAVFLRQLMASTEDDDRRAVYQAALDEIEVEQKARFLDQARGAFQKLAGHDIDRVEDLVTDPFRVIEKLPWAHPDALPPSGASGATWAIGDDGRIVSTYYGARYEVHYSPRGAGIRSRGSSAGEDESGAVDVAPTERSAGAGGNVVGSVEGSDEAAVEGADDV